MDLAKHKTGFPLTAAEHRQRRDAARARWAIAGATAVTGAAIGAGVGAVRAAIRAPVEQDLRTEAARVALGVGRARRAAAIIAAIQARQGRVPPPIPVPPVDIEQAGQGLGPGGAEGTETPPLPVRAPVELPVIGDVENRRIYHYQIAERERRMRGAPASRIPVLQAEIDAIRQAQGRPVENVDVREGHVRQAPRRIIRAAEDRIALLDAQYVQLRQRGATLAQLTDLERLRGEARLEYNNLLNPIPVQAARVNQWRGGEINRARAERIKFERGNLNAYRRHLLAALARRTEHLGVTARGRIVREVQGEILGHAGRAAAIGAALGLTAAGITLLAHHIATAGTKKKPAIAGAALTKAAIELTNSPLELTKAVRPDSPEGRIGKGLAETYRQWIDRLLGVSTAPMNLGDDLTAALAPGITQAFTAGAQNPPIDPASDPRAYVDTDFDSLNPSVRRHMADYSLDRIVQITAAQREAIRDAIMKQSVLQGINPVEVARTIREAIGLTTYQTTVVDSFRQGLRDLDPRVLERKLRDKRYDRTIQKAMDSGERLTDEQINAMVDAYHRRFIALRARTIARTEALRATSFGGLVRAQQVINENPELDVIKTWLATDDERTRDTHVDLNGREVEGIETPFITSKGNQIKWPLDVDAAADETINCRCTLLFRFIPKRGQLQAVAA